MVQREVKVSICMNWFPVYRCVEGAIGTPVDVDIKEWYFTITLNLNRELNGALNAIEMLDFVSPNHSKHIINVMLPKWELDVV